MLKRTFSFISKELFVFLYKTYVRPHLEYCAQLRSPYYGLHNWTQYSKWGLTYVNYHVFVLILNCQYHGLNDLFHDIDNLERVQRRATKLVTEFTKLTYEKLGIYSLYCRRQRGDLIETYKLLNGYYNVDWTKFFYPSPVQSTRGHQMKLFKKPSKLQLQSNFFTQRTVNMWNSLPPTVVLATNVSSFKQKLQEYWTDIGYGYV